MAWAKSLTAVTSLPSVLETSKGSGCQGKLARMCSNFPECLSGEAVVQYSPMSGLHDVWRAWWGT